MMSALGTSHVLRGSAGGPPVRGGECVAVLPCHSESFIFAGSGVEGREERKLCGRAERSVAR